jgi:putative hydrolase of the HAD superfamily
MIKNIVFDIGDVLCAFTWREYFASFGFTAEVEERMAACTVKGPLWQELDHGVMSEQEILAAFKQLDPGIADELERVYQNIDGILTCFDYTEPWIHELKAQGYRIYVISNISSKVLRECANDLGFLKLVDGAVFSFQEKVIKPDSTIFRIFLERYNLVAGECVFIDDLEKNVAVARNLGIPGIVFTSYRQAYNDLKRILM